MMAITHMKTEAVEQHHWKCRACGATVVTDSEKKPKKCTCGSRRWSHTGHLKMGNMEMTITADED